MQWFVSARVLTTAVVVAACASSAEDRGRRHNPDVITAEEIAATNVATAFEVVERLRPQFLRTRGPSSALLETRITVFQDNMNLGGIDMLRQIRAADVQEIRYLSASDATTRFGSGHPAGAIVVTSKAR